jgi:ABC-type transporter Mla MlaB component
MKSGKQVLRSTLPTMTVTPARVRLFEASQRPLTRDGAWLQTSWGRCRVVGRLGQRHADLLEAILHSAARWRDTDDETIELLVDPAKVRRKLSDTGHSGERIAKWLDELMAVVIEIDTAKLHVLGHLIDHVKNSLNTHYNALGGERHWWVVRLGIPLCELLRADYPLYYDPAPLARLIHGISQAIARHLLTHSEEPNGGSWKLDGLIEAVAGELDSQARRNARRRVRADTAGLAKLGVIVDGDRVSREQIQLRVSEQQTGKRHRS